MFACCVGRFVIKVEKHLHMIGDEPYRLDDDVDDRRFLSELLDAIAYIRFEPGLLGRARATLKDQFPIVLSRSVTNQTACFTQLLFVSGIVRHRFGNAVGSKENLARCAGILRYLLESFQQTILLSCDEAWVVEAHPNFFNQRRGVTYLGHRSGDILAILSATAVAAEHRGKERDSPLSAILRHGAESAGQEGMPIAVSPIDRQVKPAPLAFRRDGRDQCAAMFVDRADATEMLIMLGDFQHPFARNVFSSQHVFKKW